MRGKVASKMSQSLDKKERKTESKRERERERDQNDSALNVIFSSKFRLQV